MACLSDSEVLDLVETVVRQFIYRKFDDAGYAGWDAAAAGVDAGEQVRVVLADRIGKTTMTSDEQFYLVLAKNGRDAETWRRDAQIPRNRFAYAGGPHGVYGRHFDVVVELSGANSRFDWNQLRQIVDLEIRRRGRPVEWRQVMI